MRNGVLNDILTSVDIVEIFKYKGVISEVFEGFFCHNIEENPYTEFFTDMFEKVIYLNHKEKIYFRT